jgi:Rhodopirellula transposase DDE domain
MEILRSRDVLRGHGSDRRNPPGSAGWGSFAEGVRAPIVHGANRLPNLRADIKDLIDSQSQTDPRFESERVYCRLSASNVVELLIDTKGYTDLELPSNETIRKIINAEGYKLRKVQKTKPKKKSPKRTRSSTRSIG